MIYFGKNDIRNRLRRAACCLAAATTISACIKEELPAPDDGEGQPTRVEVALELPAMEIQTRAMMSEKDDSQVNTLWVGTFLASTGVKSGSAFSEVNRSDQHVFHTLTLDTKSGPSRIAGVANVDDNYGTTDNEMIDGSPSSDEDDGRVSLTALLGFIIVVASTMNISSRNTMSVIDDIENPESTLVVLLIAISLSSLLFARRLVKHVDELDSRALHLEHEI